ncbi:probable glutamate receptor [Panulirus ornatus]|uniref:probable glutamate receptor n=1 Tax=Panulirus ornatus TaxID=150431 RepID=UPI003A890F3B
MYCASKNIDFSFSFQVVGLARVPWGVVVFQVAEDGQEANVTQAQFSRVVSQARRLRQLSWCVTVVVVSDDPAFLAAFAHWSLKGRLLVWSTRLLVLTRLPLQQLQKLHRTVSMMNAMLLIIKDGKHIKGSVYVYLPYVPPGSKAILVASWTPQRGLTLVTSLQLFPDKFSKFLHRPHLVAATEVAPNNKMVIVDDAEAPGGQRTTFVGPIANLVDYLSTAVNFSYQYVLSPDRLWGFKRDDGSWTGMIGMVKREEVDVAFAPFGVTSTRAEVIDFTHPMLIQYWTMLGARGRPEVDPWGFLLPLTPLVWVAILTTLLLMPAVVEILSTCLSFKDADYENWLSTTFAFLQVLLQQNILVAGNRWWLWEQLVFGVWMMMTLVLTRSYAGNLMSLLAVKHIHEPFQTIKDVLDHPSAAMIWQTDSAHVNYFRSVESGIFREVTNAESAGRIKYQKLSQFPQSVNTLVRRGDHVLIDLEIVITMIIGEDFTYTGRCDFYSSRERFLPMILSMIGQKNSPLVPALSKRYHIMPVIRNLYVHRSERVKRKSGLELFWE